MVRDHMILKPSGQDCETDLISAILLLALRDCINKSVDASHKVSALQILAEDLPWDMIGASQQTRERIRNLAAEAGTFPEWMGSAEQILNQEQYFQLPILWRENERPDNKLDAGIQRIP